MINNEGKEMINDYAVKNEVFVGNRRYLFAVHTDEKEPQRFLKCQCYDDELFRHYVNAVTSNDFVECMKLYLADISAAVEKVEKDRAAIGLEDISCLKGSDLLSASRDKNIEGKVVAIGEKWLCDGFKDISHQLYFVKGGNGAQSNSRGNACFSINLYTGEDTRIERYEVLGEVPEDKIPEFAKEHLANARAKYAKETANERRNRDDAR